MRVTEIFLSIQGETTHAGRPCVFVRLAGCDRRCSYCDSAFAWSGGEERSVEQILSAVEGLGARFVTVTGGEPMLHVETPALCRCLLAAGWEVAVETHGQAPLEGLPTGVRRIVDVKTPGSGAEDRQFLNLESLRAGDEVKFVLTSEADFRWAVEVSRRFRLEGKVPILLSPVFGQVAPWELVAWLLQSGLNARLNLQLHKYVWSPDARGV
ncbi:MAG: radical SAM protein [Deltaproteobacteria bacterium]|nr:radical SAM protein [Deltaproteobacteria bacterium]